MKFLLTAVIMLIVSCAQRPVKVEKPEIKVPEYFTPVKGNFHKGERGFFIETKCSDFVRAVESGKVIYAGRDLENYGWVVIVEQSDGFVSVYGKLKDPWVKTGEGIKSRQVIGKVGEDKGTCGIYYELRDAYGKPIFPALR
ncbi:peptidase M23-like protein [Hydrogenivirga caldilitoris]|uniref:Peptidase M23-like protein n=1 Tax=Hydrogenivirga caldilitoris TaxID=246264 RepID=A0A497XRC9_9AQUI|nr:M23 family metallopeptidase [Hydrogenivirga caldilitoris]RLJ70750.1 peptidase M23-like protein [Hydrogenivirga caldilitoris]